MEKSLAQIAMEEFLATTYSAQDTYERVAKAVEKEVLARLKKSEFEPVAGQELSFVQVAQWIEKHGSTKGLQWQDGSGAWLDDDVKVVYAYGVYRVAPKKVNDPDDPTTWQEGATVLVRLSSSAPWIPHQFRKYDPKGMLVSVARRFSDDDHYIQNVKLATPEQIEAWKLINGDL